MTDLDPRDRALLELLNWLSLRGYVFIAPTPETHARNLKRRGGETARDVRDALGWSMPFDPATFEPEVVDLLSAAEALEPADGGRTRSALRVASLEGLLLLHSAYPTQAADAVFFGPDSYRFVRLIRDELAGVHPRRIVDVGTGSGVGGIAAGLLKPKAAIFLTDVNAEALRLARVNAAFQRLDATFLHGDGVEEVEGGFDLALLNPPYIQDDDERLYRHGGALHGGQLSIDLARAVCERLDPGGRLILYTGTAIVGGGDRLREALAYECAGCTLRYRELDPDVFAEELDRPAYADVERIAVVAAVLTRTG